MDVLDSHFFNINFFKYLLYIYEKGICFKYNLMFFFLLVKIDKSIQNYFYLHYSVYIYLKNNELEYYIKVLIEATLNIKSCQN